MAPGNTSLRTVAEKLARPSPLSRKRETVRTYTAGRRDSGGQTKHPTGFCCDGLNSHSASAEMLR